MSEAPSQFRSIRGRCLLQIASIAAALYISLALIRGYMLGVRLGELSAPVDLLGRMLAASRLDLAFVIVWTLPFILAIGFGTRRANNDDTRSRPVIGIAYLIAAGVFLTIGVINVVVGRFLGAPLSYQWLYYADFGMATDVQEALKATASWQWLTMILASVLGMLGLAAAIFLVLSWAARQLSARRRTGAPATVVLVGVIALSLVARPHLDAYPSSMGAVANPVLYFVGSVRALSDAPLLSLPTSVRPDDFRTTAERSGAERSPRQPLAPGIQNVIIFVMESVGAEYVQSYGSRHQATATLTRYQQQSWQFDHIYAHAPNSHMSLVSILTSTYPLLSYKSLTKEMPFADLSSMSRRLKARGYRTGMFYSADLRYAQLDEFLSHHSFDVVQDYRSRQCDQAAAFHASGEELYLQHSSDDRCTARSLGQWISAAGDAPFFAVLWTNMTHYPYYSPRDGVRRYDDDANFNSYLNALAAGDQALGRLLELLEERHLAQSTLVVVVGDHGEAFGQHGQFGHGASLYEENVHVPLLMLNPSFGHGQRSDVIGGLVDIAPTVFHVLGLAPSASWQGESLFADTKVSRTYFFATWTGLQFGYREPGWKYLFNATANRCEAYDLLRDPHETSSAMSASGQRCDDVKARLAAWIQYQHALEAKLAGNR